MADFIESEAEESSEVNTNDSIMYSNNLFSIIFHNTFPLVMFLKF